MIFSLSTLAWDELRAQLKTLFNMQPSPLPHEASPISRLRAGCFFDEAPGVEQQKLSIPNAATVPPGFTGRRWRISSENTQDDVHFPIEIAREWGYNNSEDTIRRSFL